MTSAQYDRGMAALIAARGGQMRDSCHATRPADPGQTPELDADGDVVPTIPETVYDDVCTIAQPRAADQGTRTSSDQSGVPAVAVLRVPHSAELRPGDLVTVTACAYSPGLVGERFLVLGEEQRSYATYRAYTLRGSSWSQPQASP